MQESNLMTSAKALTRIEKVR